MDLPEGRQRSPSPAGTVTGEGPQGQSVRAHLPPPRDSRWRRMERHHQGRSGRQPDTGALRSFQGLSPSSAPVQHAVARRQRVGFVKDLARPLRRGLTSAVVKRLGPCTFELGPVSHQVKHLRYHPNVKAIGRDDRRGRHQAPAASPRVSRQGRRVGQDAAAIRTALTVRRSPTRARASSYTGRAHPPRRPGRQELDHGQDRASSCQTCRNG